MKYVKGYYVDAKTGISATEKKLRNGPALPSDDLTVDVVDRRHSPALIVGTMPDDAELPDALEEISLEQHEQLVQSFSDWRDRYAKEQLEKARDAASLTRAEFKLALLDRGELDAVKEAMADPSADPRAVILWEDALNFKRTNQDLLVLAGELGYTEQDLDDLFGITS